MSHKNNKCVDLTCIFPNLQIYEVLLFLCSPQYKQFAIKFCILVGYNTDYVHISFISLKLICLILVVCLNDGNREAKTLPANLLCVQYLRNTYAAFKLTKISLANQSRLSSLVFSIAGRRWPRTRVPSEEAAPPPLLSVLFG
jgi:D-alanyl-lipoteichoic acid acyltransferase DltB (MBOAT superfamily)